MKNVVTLFASRFLRARKSNRLLSFLSITSSVGIMLGVATLITVISVMDGFTDNLKQRFMGANANVIVTHVTAQPFTEWPELVNKIEAVPHVTGAAPAIFYQAMISTDRTVKGVEVRGIDPASEDRVMNFSKTIEYGDYADFHNEGGGLPPILLGKEMIYTIGVNVGKEITLISPNGARSAFGMVPKMRKFRVVGFFDTGIGKLNENMAYITISDAQEMFRLEEGAVNAINVMVDNPDNSIEIGKAVQLATNSGDTGNFWARDWLSMNSALFEALKLEQFALFVILTLIIIVASFNIVSMISVTVKDKRRDIAILRAMGAPKKLISKIFIRQGLIIGLIGTIMGNLLALAIAFFLTNFKIIKISEEIYMSDTVPIRLSVPVFIITTVCALIITWLASFLPSRFATGSDPIEAIRND